MSLLTYRLNDQQSRVDAVRHVVDRDSRAKQTETSEMKAFRDEVISEHTRRIREADEKYSVLSNSFEQEKARAACLFEQAQAMTQENKQLNVDLEGLRQSEAKLVALGAKMEDVAETNRLLSLELDDRARKISEANEKIKSISEEYLLVLESHDELKQTIREHSDVMSMQKARVESLDKEVQVNERTLFSCFRSPISCCLMLTPSASASIHPCSTWQADRSILLWRKPYCRPRA